MRTVHDIAGLRALTAEWRGAGFSIGLVPTMGNLHGGHLALVRDALARAERVVTSVFVNPLQFGAGEDLDAYPRTLESDAVMLAEAGSHCLFAPSERELYPRGRADQTFVEVPGLSEILCGASRPGHFRGVATVVAKLFNIVQPDMALFGEKDYQQLMVIRRMTSDLNLPVTIVGCPTVREPDGLAMSSRNGYLTSDERRIAPRLHRELQRLADGLRAGAPLDEIEAGGLRALTQQGLAPEYVSVRRRADLAVPVAGDRKLVLLAAARLGRARLIDNLEVERPAA